MIWAALCKGLAVLLHSQTRNTLHDTPVYVLFSVLNKIDRQIFSYSYSQLISGETLLFICEV